MVPATVQAALAAREEKLKMNNILKGREAIIYAAAYGLLLNKYEDPTEEARAGLTIEEAESVVREDPSLIWIDAANSEGRYQVRPYSFNCHSPVLFASDDLAAASAAADKFSLAYIAPALYAGVEIIDTDSKERGETR